MQLKIYKVLGPTPKAIVEQDDNNSRLQVLVLDNIRFEGGDRELIYKHYIKLMAAEKKEIDEYEGDFNEENEKLKTL
jgi:flagellar motility protein MotE (MotC chaperone)